MSVSERSFSERRLNLLKKGDIADVEIIVGSDSSQQIHNIYASKVHLISSSEYFKKLIADSKEKSGKFIVVRLLPPIKPKIVRRVVEFTFLGGKMLSELKNVKQCLGLIVASKTFELEELGQYCKHVLLDKFLTVHSFWPIFDAFHDKHPLVYEATQEFLVKNSEAVLKHKALHEVSPEALSAFLQDPNLHIDSEMKLVNACINYAFANSGEDEFVKSIFRRVALPHLRLYNLEKREDVDDELKVFLTKNEYLCLAMNLAPGGFDRILETTMHKLRSSVKFSDKKLPRMQMKRPIKVGFLPRVPIYAGHIFLFSKESWKKNMVIGAAETKFVLSFKAPRNMTIVELQTLHPIRMSHFNITDIRECTYLNPVDSRWLLPSSVKIGENTQLELYETEKCNLLLSWATWETCTEVKQGSQVTIEVVFDQPCLFRGTALHFEKNGPTEDVHRTTTSNWADAGVFIILGVSFAELLPGSANWLNFKIVSREDV
ncbi:Hypothetical predicted protein [Cloeon dipterum]|uniref:BTB domain-containing protein n=1 Tax=Cloeon dipterum TaxID=197152 RepID=A0A8S1CNF6_9INSE|nr:Hypothetical predicted protein [Cloeon dipterum]